MGQRWGNIDNLLPQVALRLVSQLAYLGLFMVRRLQRLYAAFPKAMVIVMLLFRKQHFPCPPACPHAGNSNMLTLTVSTQGYTRFVLLARSINSQI